MSCGVGRRRGLAPALLGLWRRPVSTAPIRPLAREPPYAMGAAQEKAKKDKKNIIKYSKIVVSTLNHTTLSKIPYHLCLGLILPEHLMISLYFWIFQPTKHKDKMILILKPKFWSHKSAESIVFLIFSLF